MVNLVFQILLDDFIFLADIYYLGPTNLYCLLPRPTQDPSMSKLYFVGLLIYNDNFYFHCNCQFRWIYYILVLIIYFCPTKSYIGFQCIKMYFIALSIYKNNFYCLYYCQFSWNYFLGPTNLHCVLPSPTWVLIMSKTFSVGLLI